MTEWAVSKRDCFIKNLQIYSFIFTFFQKYAVTISKQLGIRGKPLGTIGDDLDKETVEMLNDDQTVQLYELMLAAKGIEGDVITKEDITK